MDSQIGGQQPGSKKAGKSRKNKKRKYGRNKIKCAAYRIRVGKPNGPGQPGTKKPKYKK